MTFIQHIQKIQGTGNKYAPKKKRYLKKKIDRVKNFVFVERDKQICKVCNGNSWNIHHILPRKDFKHFEAESLNMISLCKTCHDKADKGLIDTQTLFNLI